MIFSFTFSIQNISMFLTFRFFRDWEFRAMKIQTLFRIRQKGYRYGFKTMAVYVQKDETM
jgi:hypothetical protein